MPDDPSPRFGDQVRTAVSPQALVAGLIGAAIAGIAGKLTAHLFLSVAVVLFGVAAGALYSRAQAPGDATGRRRLLMGLALFACLLGAGTIAAGARLEATTPLRNEEKLVSSLSAGEDYSGFAAALGPPTTKRPDGPYLVYQFDRSRETLQAVVASSGEVVSYAVYAKVRDFHPRFRHGVKVILNKTFVDRTAEGPTGAVGADGYCGAHKAGYFESFGGSNAVEARYFVLGVSDANTARISAISICRALNGPLQGCFIEDPPRSPAMAKFLACVTARRAGRRLRSSLRASVYIETAPSKNLIPEMLYPPDEAANLER